MPTTHTHALTAGRALYAYTYTLHSLYSNTPRSLGVGRRDAKTGPELKKNVRGQAFRHDIGELLRGGDVKDAKLAQGHALADEVNVEFDMLGAPVMDWIDGQVHRRDVVAVHERGGLHRAAELAEELVKPNTLCHDTCNPEKPVIELLLRVQFGHMGHLNRPTARFSLFCSPATRT